MKDTAKSDLRRALTLYHNGDLSAAERLLKKILRRQPRQADARHLIGLIAFQRGKYQYAAQQIAQAVSAQPDNPTFLCNLGVAQLEADAIGDAIASSQRAVALRPRYPQALANLGLAYARIGDHDRAETAHRQAIEIDPDDAEAHFNLGNDLVALGRNDEAAIAFDAALQRDPNHAASRSNLATVLRDRGNYVAAVEQLQDAVRRNPDNAALRFNLGNVLQEAGRLEDARDAYRAAIKRDPSHVEARINLAFVLVDLGEPEAAIKMYEACRKKRPDDVVLLAALASLYEQINRLERTRELLRAGLTIDPADARLGLIEARVKRRDGHLDSARAKLIALLDTELDAEMEGEIALELGAVCDRLGAWDEAYAALVRGNRAKADKWAAPAARQRKLADYRNAATQNGRWFTQERLRSAPVPAQDGATDPAFFVGFPRSGTTLVEQILAGHPGAATSGEANLLGRTLQYARHRAGNGAVYPNLLLTFGATEIDALRDYYRRQVTAAGGNSARRWIDKLPLNLLHLGLARWIFPRAEILVALRDPRDVVLSCFQQSFRPNTAMAHFFELESAADLYITAMDLWLHYREALGGGWLEYRYEDLVAEPETTTRRILEHLGLKWSDRVLDIDERAGRQSVATPSHADVTEPIYRRSIARWRNYRDHLEPVLGKLAPYVAAFGYDES